MPENVEELNSGQKPEDQPPAQVPAEQPVEQPAEKPGAEEQPVQEEKQPEEKAAEPNPLAMSDEDFLKQPIPSVAKEAAKEPGQEPEAKPAPEAKLSEPGKEGEPGKEPIPPGSSPEQKPAEQNTENKDQPARPDEAGLNAFYDQIMTPFQANGKKITLKSPDEAIQLMQMGANYTQKMQQLAPHRKKAAMLENNNISEDRLSFLIDLDKGNPEAIKKLIMESGIDPLDIDTKVEPAYREGGHKVSDQDVAFSTQIEDIMSSEKGTETLHEINTRFDDVSKEMLYQNPEVMAVIHSQRELGIYGQITAEIDRQKTLGTLAPTTPFLEAYQTVGDQLHKAGAFGKPAGQDGVQGGQTPQADQPAAAAARDIPKPVPEVVTTRAAAPKPTVENSDKAGAAAVTRSVPGKAKEVTNFLSMSDEEFLKHAGLQGRF